MVNTYIELQLEFCPFRILFCPFRNLSDNPIICNCSLSWILNASVNLQIVGKCSNPVAVKGKAIASLTIHEMCGKCNFSCLKINDHYNCRIYKSW